MNLILMILIIQIESNQYTWLKIILKMYELRLTELSFFCLFGSRTPLTAGVTDRQTDTRTDRQTDTRTDRQTNIIKGLWAV